MGNPRANDKRTLPIKYFQYLCLVHRPPKYFWDEFVLKNHNWFSVEVNISKIVHLIGIKKVILSQIMIPPPPPKKKTKNTLNTTLPSILHILGPPFGSSYIRLCSFIIKFSEFYIS